MSEYDGVDNCPHPDHGHTINVGYVHRHQETAGTEPAARVRVAALRAAGVTCVTYYEIEDVA